MILLFSFLDLLAMIILLLQHFHVSQSWRFTITIIAYLIGKFLIFKDEPLILIDLALAIYLILMLVFGISWIITWFFIIFYIQRIFIAFKS